MLSFFHTGKLSGFASIRVFPSHSRHLPPFINLNNSNFAHQNIPQGLKSNALCVAVLRRGFDDAEKTSQRYEDGDWIYQRSSIISFGNILFFRHSSEITIQKVIIDHTYGLHKRIYNGRADKLKAPFFQILAYSVRKRRFCRDFFQ